MLLSNRRCVKFSTAKEPPLRLILGSEAYAYAYATQAASARAESDAAWRDPLGASQR